MADTKATHGPFDNNNMNINNKTEEEAMARAGGGAVLLNTQFVSDLEHAGSATTSPRRGKSPTRSPRQASPNSCSQPQVAGSPTVPYNDPRIPSGHNNQSARIMVGGSPAARRLLGLHVVKEESKARKRNAVLNMIEQSQTTPKQQSPLGRKGQATGVSASSPNRRRDYLQGRAAAPSGLVQDVGNEDGNADGLSPAVEVKHLKTALALASSWDAVVNGVPVSDITFLNQLCDVEPCDEEAMRQRLKSLLFEKAGGEEQSVVDDQTHISDLLLKRLQMLSAHQETLLPTSVANADTPSKMDMNTTDQQLHAELNNIVDGACEKMATMHGRVALAADRWEQLMARLTAASNRSSANEEGDANSLGDIGYDYYREKEKAQDEHLFDSSNNTMNHSSRRDFAKSLQQQVEHSVQFLKARERNVVSFVNAANTSKCSAPTSLSVNSTPTPLRALGVLFPEANDTRALTLECLGDVAMDLKAFVAAEAQLKHDVTHKLVPFTESVMEENAVLRRHLIDALGHITKMQTVQNALESERHVVMDVLSSFEDIVHRQRNELLASCSLALGAIDAGTKALQQQAKALEEGGEHLAAGHGGINILSLLQAFSEVKDRLTSTQRDASETYVKEVVEPLGEKLRKGTLDGVSLSEEVRRAHEAASLLHVPRVADRGNAASTKVNQSVHEKAQEEDIALTLLLKSRANANPSLVLASPSRAPPTLPQGTSLRPPMLSSVPTDPSTLPIISGRPPTANSIQSTITPLSTARTSSAHTTTNAGIVNTSSSRVQSATAPLSAANKNKAGSRPATAASTSSNPDAANASIISNSLVTSMRSQLSAAQTTMSHLSHQIHEAQKEASRQKTLASLAVKEARSEAARMRAARDALLKERSAYFDALLLALQQKGSAVNGAVDGISSKRGSVVNLSSPSRTASTHSLLKGSVGVTSPLLDSASSPNFPSLGALSGTSPFPSRYTGHQLRVIAAALDIIRRYGDTRNTVRLACYTQWKLFVAEKKAARIRRDFEDLNYCASVSSDSQSIYENFRKQHNQIRKRERGESITVFTPSPTAQNSGAMTAAVALWSVARRLSAEESPGARARSARSGTASSVIDWSREQEMADLISRITTQQALLIDLSREKDALLLQNTLLKRRLVAVSGAKIAVEDLSASMSSYPSPPATSSSATPMMGPTSNLMTFAGAFPLVPPEQLQSLIDENKPLLINPNLRKEKKKTLLGARDASLAEGVVAKNSLTQSQRRASLGLSGVLVDNTSTTAATSNAAVECSGPQGEAEDEEDEAGGVVAKTGLGGRKAVQQVILRNPLGAGPLASKAITDATRTLKGMDGGGVGSVGTAERHSKATASDPLIVSAGTAGQPNTRPGANSGGCINTNSAPGRPIHAAMPGTANSPKQAQRAHFSSNDLSGDFSGALNGAEDGEELGDPTTSDALVGRGPTSKKDAVSSTQATMEGILSHSTTEGGGATIDEYSFAQTLAEKILPLLSTGNVNLANATNSGGSRSQSPLHGSRKGAGSSDVDHKMRQIKSISKEEAALQRVADEVERNLAATSVGGIGGKGAVTLDAVQMNALKVYAILHPILIGVLRRLKVVSLKIEPLPLYEATTQPIIAIVIGWVERHFSRLLHVLTCEDRLLKVKWRMTFLAIRLRSRIAATESDIKHCRTDPPTMNLIKAQLSEYWLILKGVTSARQHAEALRKTLQTSHMGFTPEKQHQLQREMLSMVTALEDEGESYVRRSLNNTFKARRQQVSGGFDPTLFGDNPQLATELSALEDRKQSLRDVIEREATKRNARSAWAGVVLAQPEVSAPTTDLLSKSTESAFMRSSVQLRGAQGQTVGGKKGSGHSSSAHVITVNNDASRILKSPHKGADIASNSRVNAILEGVNKDFSIRQQRKQAQLMVENTLKCSVADIAVGKSLGNDQQLAGGGGKLKRKANTKATNSKVESQQTVLPTLLTPIQQKTSSAPTSANEKAPTPSADVTVSEGVALLNNTLLSTYAVMENNANALSELKQLHAVVATAERVGGARGLANQGVRKANPDGTITTIAPITPLKNGSNNGAVSPSNVKGASTSLVYGCELGPLVGPHTSRVMPLPSQQQQNQLASTPNGLTNHHKTDGGRALTDPRYVNRILKQYDTHVLAHVVPDQVNRKGGGSASTPFAVFNSERGRAISDGTSLPRDTPTDTVTRRLL